MEDNKSKVGLTKTGFSKSGFVACPEAPAFLQGSMTCLCPRPLWSMDHGPWYIDHGHGHWSMDHGPWTWSMDHRPWSMDHGSRKLLSS